MVIKWRDRFVAHGLAGLEDEEGLGARPKRVDDSAIIAARLEPPPAKLGLTHWSSRLGKHLGIGDATVARAWRTYGVRPWRRDTLKFSTDPELEGKVRDVVGLDLNPPEKAVVVCPDEKSQIQALNRTAPIGAAASRAAGEGDPRRQAQRHHHRVRRPRGRHRKGDRPVRRPAR